MKATKANSLPEHEAKALKVAKRLVKDHEGRVTIASHEWPAIFEESYADDFSVRLQEIIAVEIATEFTPPKPIEFKSRQHNGCPHCGGMTFQVLATTIGDHRDGMRSDRKCLCCGGVFGCTAAHYVALSGREWEDETGETMPEPDRDRVRAMKILIGLEELLLIRFDKTEVTMVAVIAKQLDDYFKTLAESLQRSRAIIHKAEDVLRGKE